jgi:aryl-alcohol dehydrogenase-like predicted oxidoreductase
MRLAEICQCALIGEREFPSQSEEAVLEYRNLGKSGLQVSVAGLGCNNFGRRCDQQQTSAVVDKAIELGVTLFDTADVFGPRGLSVVFLGTAL